MALVNDMYLRSKFSVGLFIEQLHGFVYLEPDQPSRDDSAAVLLGSFHLLVLFLPLFILTLPRLRYILCSTCPLPTY